MGFVNMKWSVESVKEFDQWFWKQDVKFREILFTYTHALAETGPQFGRPYVDTIKGSSYSNMKELRIQYKRKPYRILFIFDPKRQAILLVGGNKASDKRWYEVNIPIAEKRYKIYLKEKSDE